MIKSGKAIVIIPTYNEIDNIEKMIEKVLSLKYPIDILIIDDNSPDGTGHFVKENFSDNENVHLIQREGKLGLGTAYVTGFKYALKRDYEYIMEMDCDFSHNPEDLVRMLDEIKDYDLVIGSRYIQGVNVINWPLSRLILSIGASIYTRIVTGIPLRDTTSGFKCFRRVVLETINLDDIRSNGYGFQIEIHHKSWKEKFRLKELSITFTDRIDGVSKMDSSIVKEAVFMVWKLRFPWLFGKGK